MKDFEPPGVAGSMLVTRFWREFVLAVIASGGRLEDIEQLGRQEGIPSIYDMARVFVKKHTPKQTPEYVTIPPLSTSQFWDLARQEKTFTWVDQALSAWPFLTDCDVVQTGVFRVVRHQFGKTVDQEQIRYFANAYGLIGSTQLFLSWIRQTGPEGEYVSLPEPDRLWSNSNGLACAPYYSHYRQNRKAGLRDVSKPFGSYLTFVFFKPFVA